MCNETGIPEFLELQIPGIPMVVMMTSRVHSLHDPTQQDLSTCVPYPYIYVTHNTNSEEPSRVHYAIPGRNTKNEMHAHLSRNA